MRALKIAFLPLALIALQAAAPAPRAFAVDTDNSAVSARVSFFGLGSKTASFPQMTGGIRLAGGQQDQISLNVVLDATAIEAPDRVTLRRLQSENFFWVERYPTIRFSGSDVQLNGANKGTVRGTLTARGVSRPVAMEVSFDQSPQNAVPGQPISIIGETQIDRRDFGMTAYSAIVGNTVTIRLNARLVPQV